MEAMQWHDRSESLPKYTFIRDIYIDEPFLYASSNRSLWKRYLGEMNPGIGSPTSEKPILCFPNPCSSQVSINTHEIDGTIKSIQILDLQGKKRIFRLVTTPASNRLTLDVSSLLPGLYLVKVESSEGSYYSKLLIQ